MNEIFGQPNMSVMEIWTQQQSASTENLKTEVAKMAQEEDVNNRKAKHKNLTVVAQLQAKYSLPEN